MSHEVGEPPTLSIETHGGEFTSATPTEPTPVTVTPSSKPEVSASAPYLDVVGEPPAQDPYVGSLETLFTNPEYRQDEPKEPETLKEIQTLRRSAWESKAPVELRHKHKFLAHLFALGLPRNEISRKTGYAENWLSVLSRHPDFIAEVDKTRKEVFGESLEQNLRMQLPQAVKVVADILNNPNSKDNIRMETAFRVMDRTHGKPAQRVEHTGSMLKDLFAELDARETAKSTIDVATKHSVDAEAEWSQTENSSLTEELTQTEDAVNAFVKETYGETKNDDE